MDCDVAREALSARVDGEREPVPVPRVDEHLTDCGSCRDWYAQAVEQTQLLRRLAGRSQVASVPAPRERSASSSRWRTLSTATWQRWALAVVGVAQIAVATAQGLGASMGMPTDGHGVVTGGHLLNESTAWSVALGVTMLVAALLPAAAAGLAAVLAVFTVVLAGYVVSDAASGAVTVARIASHLPVLVGTALALLVWRSARSHGPEPSSGAAEGPDEIALPGNATRGRRRGHLHPTDGAA